MSAKQCEEFRLAAKATSHWCESPPHFPLLRSRMRISALHTLTGHKDRVWSVSWTPSGNILASCSGDKTVHLWEVHSDRVVHAAILEGSHTRTVRRVAWSPDGKTLATCSFDGTTSLWQNQDGEFECVGTIEGHENEVKGVAWDSTGSLLATCSRDKSIWIWDLSDGFTGDEMCIAVLHSHSQDVKSVIWHPSEELLVSSSYDDTLKLWRDEDDDWYCSHTLTGHGSTVWEAAFNSDGSKMVTCSDDLALKIWAGSGSDSSLTYGNTCTLSGAHERCIFSVDWSKEGLIATGAADDCVRVFSLDTDPTGADTLSWQAEQRKAHEGDVNCVRWNPKHPRMLASAGDDGLVKLWSVESD